MFDEIEAFCMFIGHPRSGHTLVSNLLNAHAEVVIANELDVLRFVRKGFTRNQIFSLILENDRAFAHDGAQWQGYDYAIDSQHAGSFERLRVIGDKKGGISSKRLRDDPTILDAARAKLGLPIKLIHIVRNPYDNVATWTRREGGDGADPTWWAEQYCSLADANWRVCERYGDAVITLRHEDVVRAPAEHLRRLCDFLGVEAGEDYVRDVTALVFEEPKQTRGSVEWPADALRMLEEATRRVPFLEGYEYSS